MYRYGLTVLHHAVYRDNVALVGRLLGGSDAEDRELMLGRL